jgi:hypothetical protein
MTTMFKGAAFMAANLSWFGMAAKLGLSSCYACVAGRRGLCGTAKAGALRPVPPTGKVWPWHPTLTRSHPRQ